MNLIFFGSTGLVGRHVLNLVLADQRFSGVVAPARRVLGVHPKLWTPLVNIEYLAEAVSWWQAYTNICTLGTTRRVAGSKSAFGRVDYDHPLEIARLARRQGTPTYVLSSAIGANPSPRFFCNRVKGELERNLATVGFQSLTCVEPGAIGGIREEFRLGERAIINVLTVLGPLLPRNWRASRAVRIAESLVGSASDPPACFQIEMSECLV